MFKRYAITLTLALVGASFALAAAAKGSVVTIKDKTVVVKLTGEKATWVKKGTMVKINNKFNGKVIEVTDGSVTLSSPKAGELKAGDAITFDKSAAAAGC
jgi:sorbitol-specific phosphotransferase system component IIA